MREIEFRAFVKDKNKIFNVKTIDFTYKFITFEEDNKPKDTIRMIYQVELMQYTGLKDKNGTKIYEGDIVKLEEGFFGGTYNYVSIEENENYAVYYDKYGRFDLKTEDKNLQFKSVAWHQLVEGNVEVIGNIYDNPELIKEE